jgi:hypothetical protein
VLVSLQHQNWQGLIIILLLFSPEESRGFAARGRIGCPTTVVMEPPQQPPPHPHFDFEDAMIDDFVDDEDFAVPAPGYDEAFLDQMLMLDGEEVPKGGQHETPDIVRPTAMDHEGCNTTTADDPVGEMIPAAVAVSTETSTRVVGDLSTTTDSDVVEECMAARTDDRRLFAFQRCEGKYWMMMMMMMHGLLCVELLIPNLLLVFPEISFRVDMKKTPVGEVRLSRPTEVMHHSKARLVPRTTLAPA